MPLQVACSVTSSFIMALQLFMQSFGLLNQFLPSSSSLDKDLPVWHFMFCLTRFGLCPLIHLAFFGSDFLAIKFFRG
jgi:hypothetical protein